jgi:hypothetical protein
MSVFEVFFFFFFFDIFFLMYLCLCVYVCSSVLVSVSHSRRLPEENDRCLSGPAQRSHPPRRVRRDILFFSFSLFPSSRVLAVQL